MYSEYDEYNKYFDVDVDVARSEVDDEACVQGPDRRNCADPEGFMGVSGCNMTNGRSGKERMLIYNEIGDQQARIRAISRIRICGQT